MKLNKLAILTLGLLMMVGCSWRVNNSNWLHADGVHYGDIMIFEEGKFFLENDTVYKTEEADTLVIGHIISYGWSQIVIKNPKGKVSKYKRF